MTNFPTPALLKRQGGTDVRGDTIDLPPVTVYVRYEPNRQLVRKANGDETTSRGLVFCKSELKAGDTLELHGESWEVIGGGAETDAFGKVSHYEVWV